MVEDEDETPMQHDKINEDDQLFTPGKFREALIELSIIVTERARIHTLEEKRNEKLRLYVSYPSIIFINGVFIAQVTQFSQHAQKPECSPDLWFQIIETLLLFIGAVLVTSRDFFKVDTKVAINANASEKLRSLFYTIEDYNRITTGKEGDRFKIINSLRRQYQMIVRSNPPIITNQLLFNAKCESSQDSSTDSDADADADVQERLATNFFTDMTALQYRIDRLDNV